MPIQWNTSQWQNAWTTDACYNMHESQMHVFSTPGYLPDRGIKAMSPASPALAGGFFTTSATWQAPKWKKPDWKSSILDHFFFLFHYVLLQDIKYSSSCYTVGPCCLSILYITVCIWQFQTPSLSLPHLSSLLVPQVCSLCLWACFSLINKFICVII